MNNGKYVLLNPKELEDYIRDVGRHFATPEAADALADALLPMLSLRAECMRPATAEDLAKQDARIVEMQMQILGRKFYVFDQSLDPGLRDYLATAAGFLHAILNAQHTFKKLAGPVEVTPGFLRHDFLQSALSVPKTQPAAPAPADKQMLRAQRAAPAPQVKPEERQAAEETVMSFNDGWRFQRYFEFEPLDKINKALGTPFDAIDRKKIGNPYYYYGLFDAEGNPRALIHASNSSSRSHLKACHPRPQENPGAGIYKYIGELVASKNLYVNDSTDKTGLWNAGGKHFLALQHIPPKTVVFESLSLENIDWEFSFENLDCLVSPYNNIVTKCGGLRSLGGIRYSSGGLEVTHCENLADIGALTMVGNEDGRADLNLYGNGRLTGLGGLEQVTGHLDIRGTAIRRLPESLNYVGGRIFTDAGTFRWLNTARRVLAKQAAAEQLKLLPPPNPR